MAGNLLEFLLKFTKQGTGDKQANESLKKMTNGTAEVAGRLTGLNIAGLTAVGALVGVAGALRKAYEAGKEGVSLEFAAQKFERLSESIGVTSEVMMGDLREATKGLVSDTELINSAAGIMSLGLVKTADDVVRLSKVAGALDMDMNQLTLTLSNKTTMRFDSLGVRVEGFDKRLQDLIATGMNADDAFSEAFLQQAEAQLALVGDKADSAVADFDMLNVELANAADAFKKDLAPAALDATEALIFVVENLNKAYDAARLLLGWNKLLKGSYEEQRSTLTSISATYEEYREGVVVAALASGVLSESYLRNIENTMRADYATQKINDTLGIMSQYAWEASRSVEGENASLASMALGAENAITPVGDINGALENTSAAAGAGQAAIGGLNSALGNVATLNDQVRDAQEKLGEAQRNWNENIATKSVGLLDETKLGQENYQAALAAGDEVFGTSNLLQDNLNRALEDAAEKYQETGDLEGYKQSLINIKDQYQPLDDKIKNSTQLLKDFETQAAKMDGMVIDMLINIQTQGGVTLPPGANAPVITPPSTGTGGSGSTNPVPQANGTPGWVTVPPGYPNDSYMVAMTTGEKYNVQNRRQQMGQTEGVQITIGSVTISGEQDYQRLFTRLSRDLTRVMRGG